MIKSIQKRLVFFMAILLNCILSVPSAAQTETTFSPEEVKQDLRTLKKVLEDSHISLYAYVDKETLDQGYEEIMNSIGTEPMSILEANKLFQSYVSKINNGHTTIDFPVQSYSEYAENGGTLFPLEITIEDGKAFIRKDWSRERSIPKDAEIISINRKTIKQVLYPIYPLVSGERMYFKNAQIEMLSFPRYYWLKYGKQDSYMVGYMADGKGGVAYLSPIDVIKGFEEKRTEIHESEMTLNFIDTIAYLNPGGLSGEEKTFQTFIDSSFAKINRMNSETLIIDLRNNPGGDDSFSNYIVSYLADSAFTWCSAFNLRSSRALKEYVSKNYNTSEPFWREVMERTNGEFYSYNFEDGLPMEEEKRFKGTVYALINRQSHSQSAVMAAQLQDLGLATIVGEETAEFASLYASIFPFTLPQTGISMSISKAQIIRVNGKKELKGVIPDIEIKDHLLDEEDEILQGLLESLE